MYLILNTLIDMRLKLHPFQLKMKHTFTISRLSREVQPSLIIELEQDGVSGLGEATANEYYGITVASMTQVVEQIQTKIEAYHFDTPENFWNYLQADLAAHPFVQCALDVAAHDLWAKQQNKPLYAAWELELHDKLPLTNYTIGIASIPEMVEKIREMPWPIYKIKLGTAHDLEIVRALRQETDAIFRVDANCAWSVQQTIDYSYALKELGVEFIEQPLAAEYLDKMPEVYAKSALPVMADENCRVESDVGKCAGKFHIINIKLMKCGGLTPARRMIAEARKLGMQVMIGCMTESSVGISAIAHLLPLLDYVDMDGALLISNDPAQGIEIENGRVRFLASGGTGAILI